MKYALILLSLFAISHMGKDEPATDKLNAATCYVNANCGDGTDSDIAEAIYKASQLYDLTPEQVDDLAEGFYN